MAMERQDYAAMLPQMQPGQAVDILDNRVRQVGKLNTAIADWLQERRRLEEQYSSGLRKLARRSLEDTELGIFSVPWTTLTGSADTLADSHSALAAKIEVDVERPLREFVSTNRESQAMSTVQGNLAAMARDVAKAQDKSDKLQGKGVRAETSKVAATNAELDSAQAQWDSQAPYIFESLQALDETRLNHLRDVLTQFQTHEVDQVEKSRTTAEHCLNVLLSIETADEIRIFVLKSLSQQPSLTRPQRSTSLAASAAAPSSARAVQSSSALAPSISQPDAESQRSASMQDEKKGRLKGLKRLGTVMGRRRESKPTPTLAPMVESPERKAKSSPFSALRRGRSKDTQGLEPLQDTSESRRPQMPPTLGSETLEPPLSSGDEPATPSPAQRSERARQVNGFSSSSFPPVPQPVGSNGNHQGDLADIQPLKPSQPSQPLPSQPSQPLQTTQPMQPTQRDIEPFASASEPGKDKEGYSLPPQGLDPITQAQQEAAAANGGASSAFNVNIRNTPLQDEGANSNIALASITHTLQAPPPSRRLGTLRGRRDARNSYISPQEQIQETETASLASAAPVAPAGPSEALAQHAPAESSKEIAASPTSYAPAVQPPYVNPVDSVAQAPSSGFSPSGGFAAANLPFAGLAGQSSPFRPDSRAATGSDNVGADAQSIRSGRSLTSTGSQGTKHPELTETGLNSSIVETVNARFENGKILSSTLVGEIALAYNAADFSSPFGLETIRLENFSSLEKVAPNPAFITQIQSKEGTYSVNLSNITKTQVAFKYQLKADDANAQAPLLLAPAFKIEPTQASIIVSYSLNPAFNLHGRESITLSKVVIGLTLEGAPSTTCLSRPAGTFSKERNLIFWQLGDVTLKAGAAPEKLLARFATETEAKGGNVDARWEISGEHGQGLGSGLFVSMQSPTGGASEGADPFADEEGASGLTAVWKGTHGVRKLASGIYTAK